MFFKDLLYLQGVLKVTVHRLITTSMGMIIQWVITSQMACIHLGPRSWRPYQSHKGTRNKYFANAREACRKDVERAFGILQARFAFSKGPAREWDEETLAAIIICWMITFSVIAICISIQLLNKLCTRLSGFVFSFSYWTNCAQGHVSFTGNKCSTSVTLVAIWELGLQIY